MMTINLMISLMTKMEATVEEIIKKRAESIRRILMQMMETVMLRMEIRENARIND